MHIKILCVNYYKKLKIFVIVCMCIVTTSRHPFKLIICQYDKEVSCEYVEHQSFIFCILFQLLLKSSMTMKTNCVTHVGHYETDLKKIK